MSFELFCQVANSFSKKCQDLFFLFLDDRWLGIRDVSCLAEVDIAQAHADRIPLDATTRENGESDSAVMRSGESELILVGLRVVTMSWLFCNCSWSRECLSVRLGPDPPCTANNGNILFFREPHPRSHIMSCLIWKDLVSKYRSALEHPVPLHPFMSEPTLSRSPFDLIWPRGGERYVTVNG